jgi:hypothetical protein
MDEIRWRGLTHQEIYDRVWAGPGHVASADAQGMWGRIQDQLAGIDQELTTATSNLGDGWEGTTAAEAAQNLSLLGSWVTQAVRNASKTGAALDTQAEYVATMRNNLPPPPEPAFTPDLLPNPFGLPTPAGGILEDLQALDVRNAELNQQAVQVMETYTANSANNKPHIHPFAAPITVTAGSTESPGFFDRITAAVQRTAAAIAASGAQATAGALGGPAVVAGAAAGAAAGIPLPGAGGAAGGPAGGGPSGPGAPGTPIPGPLVPGGGPGTAPGRVPGTVPGGGTGTGPGGPGTAPGRVPGGVPGGTVPVPGRPGGGLPTGDPIIRGPNGGPATGPAGVPGGRIPSIPGSTIPGGFPGTSGLPGSGGGPGGTGEPGRGAASPTTPGSTAPGSTTGRTPGPGYVPGAGMGGGVGGQSREHRRPSYLIDDTDAFGDDRWFTPAVITPDDPLPRR